jgi:hypothetical protein
MGFEDLVVAPVRLESNIEQIAYKGYRAGNAFDADIQHHSSNRRARHSELDGALNNVQGNQRVYQIPDARDQADNPGKTEAKTSRQHESVIEPTRDRLDIGNSGIDLFGYGDSVRLRVNRYRVWQGLCSLVDPCTWGASPERQANKWRNNCSSEAGMALNELRNNEMMAHLIDSLEAGKDIGHYGRLVFTMVARTFISSDEIIALLQKGADCDEEKARALVQQVEQRGYNPPRRDRVLEWMEKQKFPICPNADDPAACNVYRDLDFPEEIYDRINAFYREQSSAAA